MRRWSLLLALTALAISAEPAGAAPLQTQRQAITEDAARYSAKFGVDQAEAERRLKAQQASVPELNAIAAEFASRLAGISVEHGPVYRFVVLLTGSHPVAPRTAANVPVEFRTGARATRAQAVAAMRRHLIDFRSALPGARGAGYDQRTGEIVLLVTSADAQRVGLNAIGGQAERVSGVPVRVIVNPLLETNMVSGGGRVEGLNTQTGRRNLCTSGFLVTDGKRVGLATAAHCPDQLDYRAANGTSLPLPFIEQWGVGYYDLQINEAPEGTPAFFYADRPAGSLRPVYTWRNVASTRAGDFVCHYGESSGYSCAEVTLTDYAPPGALCGGPCAPAWVAVNGPDCMTGDSGGPVFSGTVAFGIAKGINRSPSGRCNFYYYMPTDYLPTPWRLLVASPRATRQRAGRP
jgi:hypothetical protein